MARHARAQLPGAQAGGARPLNGHSARVFNRSSRVQPVSPVPVKITFTGGDGADLVSVKAGSATLFAPQSLEIVAPEDVVIESDMVTVDALQVSAEKSILVTKGVVVESTAGGNAQLTAPKIDVQPGATVQSLPGASGAPDDVTLLATATANSTDGVFRRLLRRSRATLIPCEKSR